MPLRSFVDAFITHADARTGEAAVGSRGGRWRGYLAQHALLERVPELAAEAPPPRYVPAHRGAPLCNVWMGPAGAATPLHRDPYSNLFVQASGLLLLLLV